MLQIAYNILRLNFSLYPGIVNYRSATFLKRHYELRKNRHNPLKIAANFLVFYGFQSWVPWRIRQIARQWNLDETWQKNALKISQTRIVDPLDIALFRIEKAEELDYFMRRFEHIAVGRTIANTATDHSDKLLNKSVFYALCQANGIEHPRVLMHWSDGAAVYSHPAAPGSELFVKPVKGSGGRGAFVFQIKRDETGEAGLTRLCKTLARDAKGEWVVQQRFRPHAKLAAIACNALPTARIITIKNEFGGTEIVSTVLRLAANKDAIVDNIGQGGLCAAIDPSTGVLSGSCAGRRAGEHPYHPVTGGQIDGITLPDWDEAKALALDTHNRLYPDHVMIGWDVALTDSGPLMLEGNARPSMILAQRATRTPVGKTRMGYLIGWHLEKRLHEQRERPALLVS